MTNEELKALTDEEFHVLQDNVSAESSRRKALGALTDSVKQSVKEYRAWGGDAADLKGLLEDAPEAAAPVEEEIPEDKTVAAAVPVEVSPGEPETEGFTF